MTLFDAIDQNVYIIDDEEISDDEIQAMSIDNLETLKIRINKRISGISASIRDKKFDYKTTGKAASKDWFMKSKSALSINQRVLSYVNYLVKKRQKASRTISDYFMEQARGILPRQDYEHILNSAHNEKEIIEHREGLYEGDNFNTNTLRVGRDRGAAGVRNCNCND